ncbi:hypothetical protein Y032_0081g1408 [Ancylostoma ceylanicum]|uniref:Uncharacterized protein n=1 Tax=Ancylostoma ceylanicum TaxID=53326 RepID=A0A016TRX4_9BILA|nr:hypothetical protein Y032_0081g1408 [Ancylostoma ceylanicum]
MVKYAPLDNVVMETLEKQITRESMRYSERQTSNTDHRHEFSTIIDFETEYSKRKVRTIEYSTGQLRVVTTARFVYQKPNEK